MAYGESYSLEVCPEAEDWVSPLGFFEAKESPVKTENTLLYLSVYGFSDAPSVACGFNYQLGCYAIFAPELFIRLPVELCPRPDVADAAKSFYNYPEKR
ncbi:MAG: hypothetical protein AOA65_0167 [Candidatus Bathyarchaeota archaeon BA1]|nr:MAG: hypothetical protein AOA65_0167 [Candidatus Bathyarchaeota archaeon BA1]